MFATDAPGRTLTSGKPMDMVALGHEPARLWASVSRRHGKMAAAGRCPSQAPPKEYMNVALKNDFAGRPEVAGNKIIGNYSAVSQPALAPALHQEKVTTRSSSRHVSGVRPVSQFNGSAGGCG